MEHILNKYKNQMSSYSESTKENYIISTKVFLKFLKWYKGKSDIITVCNISKEDIFNYIAYLENKSKGTIKNRLYGLKNFYSFLNRDLSEELFEDIKLYSSQTKLPKILTWNETDLLLDYYQDKRNKLIIFLFLQTGIRLSELANIKIEDINLKDQYIRVISKGGKERQVYISNHTKELIEDYGKKEGYLFDIKKREIQYVVTKAMKELGIKGSTHTLRHTIATKMYEQTQDILLVKEFLGHKSITSTQIYTHISNNLVKDAVNKNPLAHFKVGEKR